MWETGGALAGGNVDVVEVLSGTVLTGGQSMGVCCGECSSFFVSSNLVSLVGDSAASVLVRFGVSSFTSMDSVGVRSQSGESYSMG